MASKFSYQVMWIPVVAVLLFITLGFFALYTPYVMQATVRDPQTVAGAAQIADTATPAEQYRSVTTGARPLPEREQPRNLPEGQPGNQPAESPQRAGQPYPDNPR